MKEEEVEVVRQRVQDSKYGAQLIVDDIEADKLVAGEKIRRSSMINDASSLLKDISQEAVEALSKVRRPPKFIGRIMDCILILFQRRVLPIGPDANEWFVRPSWKEAVRVRD